MATKIGTLQNPDKTEALLPRTCLKAVADKNGDYLDEDLTASDINALKNGKISSLMTSSSSFSGTTNSSYGYFEVYTQGVPDNARFVSFQPTYGQSADGIYIPFKSVNGHWHGYVLGFDGNPMLNVAVKGTVYWKT